MTDHLFPLELQVILGIEHLVHIRSNEQRILDAPRGRGVMQELEFQRQTLATLIDERIHAARIDLEQVTFLRFERGCRTLACLANLQITLSAIVSQQTGP